MKIEGGLEKVDIAVIGGSGLYSMEGLKDVTLVDIETPFGLPSDPIVVGSLGSVRVAFLPRHGRGHRLVPAEVPMRANIYALKSLGVRWIISVSACGSLRESFRPGDIVIPNGLFDHTSGRPGSFFGEGCVAHVGLAEPFCPVLSKILFDATKKAIEIGDCVADGTQVHEGGNLIVINGPRFSTKAESHVYRAWGMDLINMTTCPEAALAREAEIAYAVMNHVTDYDCWHETEEHVSVDKVIAILLQNVSLAQNAIRHVVYSIAPKDNGVGSELTSPAFHALKDALLSRPHLIPIETRRKLQLILAKYIGDIPSV